MHPMTVTFLGENIVVPFAVFSQRTRFRSDTVGWKRRGSVLPGHRWAGRFIVVPSDPEAFLVEYADLDVDTTFQLSLEPFPGSAEDPANSATMVNGNASVRQTYVDVDDGSRLLKGRFVKFATQDKLYKVKSVSGNRVNLVPELQTAIPDNTEVTASRSDAPLSMACLLDLESDPGLEFSDGLIAEVGPIPFVEAT